MPQDVQRGAVVKFREEVKGGDDSGIEPGRPLTRSVPTDGE